MNLEDIVVRETGQSQAETLHGFCDQSKQADSQSKEWSGGLQGLGAGGRGGAGGRREAGDKGYKVSVIGEESPRDLHSAAPTDTAPRGILNLLRGQTLCQVFSPQNNNTEGRKNLLEVMAQSVPMISQMYTSQMHTH